MSNIPDSFSFTTPKGTVLPLLNLRGKKYLQVAYRIQWMREEHPLYSIETEFLVISQTESAAKATIKNESGRIIATAHKTETQKDFPAGHAEKAETGAIGRALALCGYGTQFTDDLDEGERLADSPVAQPRTYGPTDSGEEISRLLDKATTNQREVIREFVKSQYNKSMVGELTAMQKTVVLNKLKALQIQSQADDIPDWEMPPIGGVK